MYEELIRKLNILNNNLCIPNYITKITREAVAVIEELMSKDEPIEIEEIHVDEYYCPACGSENNADQGFVYDRYCPQCGQRLLAHEKEAFLI